MSTTPPKDCIHFIVVGNENIETKSYVIALSDLNKKDHEKIKTVAYWNQMPGSFLKKIKSLCHELPGIDISSISESNKVVKTVTFIR